MLRVARQEAAAALVLGFWFCKFLLLIMANSGKRCLWKEKIVDGEVEE